MRRICQATQCNDYGESGGILIRAALGQPSLPRRPRFNHGQVAEVELHSVSHVLVPQSIHLIMCSI